jgi:hypothetical protein
MVAVRFIILVFGGQKQIALEKAALRQQLAALKRNVKRSREYHYWIFSPL